MSANQFEDFLVWWAILSFLQGVLQMLQKSFVIFVSLSFSVFRFGVDWPKELPGLVVWWTLMLVMLSSFSKFYFANDTVWAVNFS